MPQFDIFSFFSQLFWVFFGFSYLYLMLCFYILPAIGSTLKTRAKKLTQISGNLTTGDVVVNPISNLPFFESLTVKLSGISLIRTNLNNDINGFYNSVTIKNEAFCKYTLSLLNDVKIITFFI
jgi:hypothetical protein